MARLFPEGLVTQEVELKLELDPRHARSLSRQALFRDAEPSSEHLESVYYDTPGGKLRKNGFTLRVRSTKHGFVQTVKSLETSAGLFSRGEWESPVGSIEPHVEQLARTPAGEVGARKLRPVVRSAVERKSWQAEADGAVLEFAFDKGELSAEGREAPICELEIELLKGDAARAFDAARKLAERVPVRIGVLSKAERGFALADGALAKPSKAGPVPVRPEMSVAEGFAVIAQSCLRHFRLNEPLVVEQRNPLALHQARVAMRRLRTALSLFRPALQDSELPRLREELRWFTTQLGDARNLDVYLQREIPEEERSARTKERDAAYDRVIAAVESSRFRLLMIDLVRWVALGAWRRSDKARRPLPDYAGRRIARLWLKISAFHDLKSMDDESRHRLRIEIKKLRYALEFVEALSTHQRHKRRQFAKAVEALQESLGHLNDLVTARSMLALPDAGAPVVEAAEEAKWTREADRCLDRLRKIGPYWMNAAV